MMHNYFTKGSLQVVDAPGNPGCKLAKYLTSAIGFLLFSSATSNFFQNQASHQAGETRPISAVHW